MPDSLPVKLAYRLRTAADAVDRSPYFLQREIEAGRLRAKKQGREYLIPMQYLQDWPDQLPDA